MPSPPRTAHYDVEVLETEDLWAKYGAKLPDEPPTSKPARYPWRRLGTYSLGVLFTVSLHLALISSMLLGTAGRPPLKPLTEGAPASSPNSDASEFVTTLILINDHSITPPDKSADESAYAPQQLAAQPPKAEVMIASVDATAVPDVGGSANGTDANSPTIEATGDDAGRAMLFGRYMGQIKARIERAWEYPTTSTSDKFDCKVQIKQTQQGQVEEITLQRCDADPQWQVSLVQAIQQASPLSAPPDESVFTEVMTLSFSAAFVLNAAQAGR